MSASIGDGGSSQDVDLNLAPIIDCFTVLITFLLASASFLAVGILSTNPGIPSASPSAGKPPSVNLEVELQPKFEIMVRVSGKEKREKKIPAVQGTWDLNALKLEVADVKQKWPDTQSLVLSATDDIEYLHIVSTMEALRKTIPSILLGGF